MGKCGPCALGAAAALAELMAEVAAVGDAEVDGLETERSGKE